MNLRPLPLATTAAAAPRRRGLAALWRSVCHGLFNTRGGMLLSMLVALGVWMLSFGVAVAQDAAAPAPVPAPGPSPTPLPAALTLQIQQLALDGSARLGVPGLNRVEVHVGALDARLRLAPCERIEPYWPANSRLWGATRVGLRCVVGATRWNVYLPLTVRVLGRALVAARPLTAGAVLTEADVTQAEVDWAEDPSATFQQPEPALGRTLARALSAGQALRQSHLRARQWFVAGDVVKVMARGAGFAVAGSAQALTQGIEGQPARVRTESGRVLTGLPVAERQVEVAM